jgi:hypothetical protein
MRARAGPGSPPPEPPSRTHAQSRKNVIRFRKPRRNPARSPPYRCATIVGQPARQRASPTRPPRDSVPGEVVGCRVFFCADRRAPVDGRSCSRARSRSASSVRRLEGGSDSVSGGSHLGHQPPRDPTAGCRSRPSDEKVNSTLSPTAMRVDGNTARDSGIPCSSPSCRACRPGSRGSRRLPDEARDVLVMDLQVGGGGPSPGNWLMTPRTV